MNTIGFARREVARTPDGELHVVEAPSYGFGAVVEPQGAVSIDDLVLEHEHVRAQLAPDGTVVSLLQGSSGRETLAAPGNRLELYDDRPVDCDAWDIDPFHLETRRDCPPAESSLGARCESAPLIRLGRRHEPHRRHHQARRGFRRSGATALRGERRARNGAGVLGLPFESARLANALEDDGQQLEVEGDAIVVPIGRTRS